MESLLNYQTLITELTGLEFSNASLLDEATAAAEAMYLAHAVAGGKKKDFFISENLFPFIKDTIRSRAYYLGINIIEGNHNDEAIFKNENLFGGIVQNPDNYGKVHDLSSFAAKMKEIKGLSIVAADIMSLLLVKSPGEMGFDVAVGSAQRFGVPMMNGGPHAGFMATRDEFKRKIPGRVVGVSKDRHGKRALRLSLQTREQHIRRDKATSNICTAQALLANMSAFFAIFHGKTGLIDISNRINIMAVNLQEELAKLGYKFLNQTSEIFDTIVIKCAESGINAEKAISYFEENKINLRNISSDLISVTINEVTTLADVEELVNVFSKFKGQSTVNIANSNWANNKSLASKINQNLTRGNVKDILNQDIFNSYSSESQILRYIYYLQMKDISLCNSMITLGSCTMKLNATSELVTNLFFILFEFQIHFHVNLFKFNNLIVLFKNIN